MKNFVQKIRWLTLYLFLMLPISLFLTSCAHLNEGAVDYRKSDLKNGKGARENYLTLIEKYRRGSYEDSRIFKNDSISIHLQQAFIKDFYEVAKFWKGESNKELRGEIAVVVRAFELEEGQDFEFSPNAAESGRLIFYSDDTRKGQYLNLSFLPIYGPITYNGNPIGIQLYILELDSGNQQLKPLLSELAAAGTKLYPPASPVLSLIEALGSSLLSGNKSDILFRYSMVLHPDSGYVRADYPILEVGHYVFIRKEKRQEPLNWEVLRFDKFSGRLMKAESDSKGEGTDTENLSEYKDETYFVIEIQKGFDPTSLDLAQNTFGEFIAELDKKNVQEIKEYRDIASKFVDQQLQISKFGELRNLVNEISRTDADEQDRCERLSADLIEQLSIQIENENAEKKENKNAERDGFLTPDQIDYLLRNTRYLVKDKTVRAQIRRDYVKNTNNHLNIVNAICLSNK